MIKVVSLFKKKDGLSLDEFKDYYENHHSKLFDEYLKQPGVHRYTRRYLHPLTDTISGEARSADFDVIMEVWCDPAWFESFYKGQLPADFRAAIAADEEKLFDRDRMFIYTVDEHDTDLSAL